MLVRNPYGFNHEAVLKQFGGGARFVNTMEFEWYVPVAVYHCPEHDKSKGHKEYLLLSIQNKQTIISGMDKEQIEKYRYTQGVRCRGCCDEVFSVMRHDNAECLCGAVSIDGGRSYQRVSGVDLAEMIWVDLFLGKSVSEEEVVKAHG